MMVTYGSVCSGIEAASVAWGPLGMMPLWFSEIEPFPCSVLRHHWPSVPNLGDMTSLPGLIRAGLVTAPDILIGGTPCQAFSVAGIRRGLDDERGQLTMTYVEVLNAIDERRDEGDEAVCVWENVPGVLSSDDNAFGCFLGFLSGSDAALHPEPRPESGRNSKWWRWDKKTGESRCKWPNAGCVLGPKRATAWRVLDAQYFGVTQRRRRVFLVASARAGFDPTAVLFEREGVRRDNPPSRKAGQDVAGTLDARTNGGGFPGTDGACSGHTQPIAFGQNRLSGPVDVSHALRSKGGSGHNDFENETFIHAIRTAQTSSNGWGVNTDETAYTLDGAQGQAVQQHLAVRRLTPVECERLQGFPDGYTDVPYKGKPAADGPRYKAIGNSKAVPVVQWIGCRLLTELG